MTRPTDELRADHALIQTGLGILGAIAGHVRRGGGLPVADTASTLRFLREFLIATHFRKENEIVWPAVTMHLDEHAATSVGELMLAQDEAAELIACLVIFWEPIGELTADERQGFADTVDALEKRMAIMAATEARLFSDCDRDIPLDDRIDWVARFAAIEAERVARAAWEPKLR
ncbi:MAG: hypothetical protein KDC98_00940, partial [Planctomycetes bacterium]|nr:hypothetical protein [Planctomycetota bacterium]